MIEIAFKEGISSYADICLAGLAQYGVRAYPADGGDPQDVVIVDVDPDAEEAGTLCVRRLDLDTERPVGDPFTMRVRRVEVY